MADRMLDILERALAASGYAGDVGLHKHMVAAMAAWGDAVAREERALVLLANRTSRADWWDSPDALAYADGLEKKLKDWWNAPAGDETS